MDADCVIVIPLPQRTARPVGNPAIDNTPTSAVNNDTHNTATLKPKPDSKFPTYSAGHQVKWPEAQVLWIYQGSSPNAFPQFQNWPQFSSTPTRESVIHVTPPCDDLHTMIGKELAWIIIGFCDSRSSKNLILLNFPISLTTRWKTLHENFVFVKQNFHIMTLSHWYGPSCGDSLATNTHQRGASLLDRPLR